MWSITRQTTIVSQASAEPAAPLTDFRNLPGFDLRPFLYPANFSHQFKAIDRLAKILEDRRNAETAPTEGKAKVD